MKKTIAIIFLFICSGAGLSTFEIALAIRIGNKNVVRALLEGGIYANEIYDEALLTACQFDQTELVELLLRSDHVNPAAKDNLAISTKFALKNEKNLQLLLQTGKVDASARNNRAIIIASEAGNAQVVKMLLLQKNVDPSDQSNRAIQRAVFYGRVEVVKILLADKRVNPADKENAAIRDLSLFRGPNFEERCTVLKLLLEDGRADPSVNNNEILTRLENVENLPATKLLEDDERVQGIQFLKNLAKDHLTSTDFLKLLDSPLKWETPSYVESVFSERPNDLVALFCSDIFKITVQEAKAIRNLDDFEKYIHEMHKETLKNEKSLLSEKKKEFLWRYYGLTLGRKDNSFRFQELTIEMNSKKKRKIKAEPQLILE